MFSVIFDLFSSRGPLLLSTCFSIKCTYLFLIFSYCVIYIYIYFLHLSKSIFELNSRSLLQPWYFECKIHGFPVWFLFKFCQCIHVCGTLPLCLCVCVSFCVSVYWCVFVCICMCGCVGHMIAHKEGRVKE